MNRDVSPRLVSPARPFSPSFVQAVFRRALESRPTQFGSPVLPFSDKGELGEIREMDPPLSATVDPAAWINTSPSGWTYPDRGSQSSQ